MEDLFAALRLKNQLCFPLYAVSNIITRKYKPLLDRLDLTYTQYIVMMVLWEQGPVNEKFLCESLFLKSNTVTPLIQKLERKGLVEKKRNSSIIKRPMGSRCFSGLRVRRPAFFAVSSPRA